MSIQPGFTTFVEYAPGQAVANTDLPVLFEDIAPRTGIHSRHVAGEEETVETLCLEVAKRFFDKLGIGPRDCGALVVSGFLDTSANLTRRAAGIADRLGIRGPSFGVNYACSGFPAAVQLALEKVPDCEKHVLILTAEMLSRSVNWADQGTAILFGDRAAATTLHPKGRHKILTSWAEQIPDDKHLISYLEVEDAMDPWGSTETRKCLVMNGRPLYRMAPKRMFDLSVDGVTGLGFQPGDLAIIAQHQANGKFAEKLRALLDSANLMHVEVANVIGHMGNVAASSIPCALLQIEDKLHSDKIVACPAVGAGADYAYGKLSQGVVIFRSPDA